MRPSVAECADHIRMPSIRRRGWSARKSTSFPDEEMGTTSSHDTLAGLGLSEQGFVSLSQCLLAINRF